ncbi:MAG: hypothetical protein O7C75_02115 [Verrucomicrobia bacterium]|nr:hypothetical protein [Verrucomicrobiota bacterium]
MKISQWMILFAVSLTFFGCSSTEYRIKKHPERFAALSQEEQTAVQNKTLDLGHSTEVVYFIMGNPDRKKRRVKDGVNKEIWEYSRIYTQLEGTELAGYERRIYYDTKNKVYRVYYIPRYVHLYSEHQEIVAEIEFEDGKVSAITEYDS